jgi:hypothetical protein
MEIFVLHTLKIKGHDWTKAHGFMNGQGFVQYGKIPIFNV